MPFERSSGELVEVTVDPSQLMNVVVLSGVAIAPINKALPDQANHVEYFLSPQLALGLAGKLLEAVKKLYDIQLEEKSVR